MFFTSISTSNAFSIQRYIFQQSERGGREWGIDLSRIPVNKGTNWRLGWTKYSDLYEIVQLSLLVLISLCLLTEA